jgi:hypothetical protein
MPVGLSTASIRIATALFGREQDLLLSFIAALIPISDLVQSSIATDANLVWIDPTDLYAR